MHNYRLILSNKAEKQLDKLSDKIAEPIIDALENLKTNPRPNGYIKLKGKNSYRIRIGNYRVVYDIFDGELVIEIITLGHRKDIYD